MRHTLLSLIVMAVLAVAIPAYGMDSNSTEAQDDSRYRSALEALKLLNPMKPEDIKQERQRFDGQSKAAEPIPAKMITESRVLQMQPGTPPHVVRTSPGYASSLIFADSTGAPWPITSAVIGNPAAFNVIRPEVAPGNYVSVVPLTDYTPSSLTLTLAGAATPIVISLVTESSNGAHRVSDALISFRIDHKGPNAKEPIVKPLQGTVSNDMLSFLDGIPPNGAVKLKYDAKQDILLTSIWDYNGRFYLRTPATVLWPAWVAMVEGVDDMRLYELPTVPSLLLSVNGQSLEVVLHD